MEISWNFVSPKKWEPWTQPRMIFVYSSTDVISQPLGLCHHVLFIGLGSGVSCHLSYFEILSIHVKVVEDRSIGIVVEVEDEVV